VGLAVDDALEDHDDVPDDALLVGLELTQQADLQAIPPGESVLAAGDLAVVLPGRLVPLSGCGLVLAGWGLVLARRGLAVSFALALALAGGRARLAPAIISMLWPRSAVAPFTTAFRRVRFPAGSKVQRMMSP